MEHAFYGEVGVHRVISDVLDERGHLDEDYDDDNPDGSQYGRRNYGHCRYYSGMGSAEPQGFRKID